MELHQGNPELRPPVGFAMVARGGCLAVDDPPLWLTCMTLALLGELGALSSPCPMEEEAARFLYSHHPTERTKILQRFASHTMNYASHICNECLPKPSDLFKVVLSFL